jgi:hypothetical protein
MQSESFDRFWESWDDEKKSLATHVLCESVGSDTEAGLRQNHVMWLRSRDVTKMTRCQDEVNKSRLDQFQYI